MLRLHDACRLHCYDTYCIIYSVWIHWPIHTEPGTASPPAHVHCVNLESVNKANDSLMGWTWFPVGSALVDRRELWTARLPAVSICCQMETVSKVCGKTSLWATLTCAVQTCQEKTKVITYEELKWNWVLKNNEKCPLQPSSVLCCIFNLLLKMFCFKLVRLLVNSLPCSSPASHLRTADLWGVELLEACTTPCLQRLKTPHSVGSLKASAYASRHDSSTIKQE